MISGAVMGTRAVGFGRTRTIPETFLQPAPRAAVQGSSMRLVGWAAIITSVHDDWTFAAFILLLIAIECRRRR
jgi:hypothetical protein